MFRFFENLVDPFKQESIQTSPKSFWQFIGLMLKPYHKVFPYIALTGLAAALVEAGLIYYSGRIIDLISNNTPASLWASYGLELTIISFLILFVRPLVFLMNQLMLNQSLAGSMRDAVRWRSHHHLIGQSRAFFQSDFAGRLANRVMQVGPAVENNVYTTFEAIWYAATYFLTAMFIMAQINIWLVVPMLVWITLYIVYVIFVSRRISRAARRMSETRSMVTARIVDAYTNIETVKLFVGDDRERDFALFAIKKDRIRFQKFLRLMTKMTFGLGCLTGTLIVGVVGLALYLWTYGTITVGEISSTTVLVLRLTAMTGWIMWVTIHMFENAGNISEAMYSLSVPHSVTDTAQAAKIHLDKGRIEFEGISHHYGTGIGGLDQVDLTIQAGEKVGFVGRSGAGKTTLVNLLLRFMDPETGQIRIDGQDIRNVQQESFRQHVGMVTQEPGLMHRSVRDNILQGKPDATAIELQDAIAKADAADFIPLLKDENGRIGLDAHVGERGVKLSGGQRQRIALARVVLKNAPILVLDEATSALDSESEAMIQNALHTVMKGKTVIAIAHRLSTIAQMDRIVVLDKGRIAEQGTHKDLIKQGGLYAQLWKRQSGEFLKPDHT